MKVQTLGERDRSVVLRFLSDFDRLNSSFGATVLLRTTGDPNQMVGIMRREVAALDPGLPPFNIKPLSSHVEEAPLLLPRLCGALFGTFGVTGLFLAIIGLFALVNCSVRARTREIGVRMAIGATPAAIAAMVALKGLALIAFGLAIGLAAAFALCRFISSFLYGISPTDAVTFAVVPAVLLVSAGLAVYYPARRASRINPLAALRYE